MHDMRAVLEQCRKNFATPPRTLTPRERCDYFAMPPPKWLQQLAEDGIWEIYRAKQTLLTHGTLVWGHIVQANGQLFSAGKLNCPGMAIYSMDPDYEDDLAALQMTAARLFELKGTQPKEPVAARFATVITNERDRSMRVPVPRQFSQQREVYATTIMVFRQHLPNGILSHRYFPLLVHPQTTPCTLILPHQYWPAWLCSVWQGEEKDPIGNKEEGHAHVDRSS